MLKKTTVYLSDDDGWLARFEFAEAPRQDAAQAISTLQARGIEVYLLSGDQPDAVLSMGRQLGIHHLQGGCTPAMKLASMQALQQQGVRQQLPDGGRRRDHIVVQPRAGEGGAQDGEGDGRQEGDDETEVTLADQR